MSLASEMQFLGPGKKNKKTKKTASPKVEKKKKKELRTLNLTFCVCRK